MLIRSLGQAMPGSNIHHKIIVIIAISSASRLFIVLLLSHRSCASHCVPPVILDVVQIKPMLRRASMCRFNCCCCCASRAGICPPQKHMITTSQPAKQTTRPTKSAIQPSQHTQITTFLSIQRLTSAQLCSFTTSSSSCSALSWLLSSQSPCLLHIPSHHGWTEAAQ